MAVGNKNRDEKLQYDINGETGKILALSSVKIEKYKYLSDEEMLPSDQSRMIEQTRYTYYPLGKALEKKSG